MTQASLARPFPDSPPVPRGPEAWRPSFPALEQWLVDGGDTRLDLDPASGVNRYGCAARPASGDYDFSSSTASTVSPRGWAAAEALAERLAETDSRIWRPVTYGREMDRVRGELLALNGLEDMPGLDLVFAASGTDAHLLVADLVGDATRRPLLCLAIEPEETGSGVPAALNRRHFSTVTALGERVEMGEAVGVGDGGYASIPSRRPDGSLRPSAEIAAEPSGADETFWVTDAGEPAAKVIEALARDGVAAHLLAQAGGLKLFALAGFYQRDDQRLARAPGRLTGVIGSAATAFDL